MSIRVSLETETATVTRLDRNRTLSDVHVNTANSSAEASQRTEDSDFRDSLRAHLNSRTSEDRPAKHEGDATTTAGSPSSIMATNATDCRNPDQRLVVTAADKAQSRETSLNRSIKMSPASLVVPANLQMRAFKFKENGRAVAASANESLSGGKTMDNANKIGAAPDAMVLVNPIGVVPAPDQNGPIGSAVIALPDSVQASSTGSVIPFTESNTSTSSSLPATSQSRHPQVDFSNGWQAVKSDVQPFATPANENIETSKAIDAGSSVDKTDHSFVVQARPLVSSASNASAGSQVDDAGTMSSASGDAIPVTATGSEKQTSLERNPPGTAKEGSATSPPRFSSVQDQAPVPGRSTDATGRTVQSTLDSAASEAVRDDQYHADSNVSILAAASNGADGAVRIPKSSRSYSAQSGVHPQKLKNTSENTLDALAPGVPDSSRNAQLTNGGSSTQKLTEATSRDGRLQNTFSALEPSSRNDAGAFNWTRTGHMQAEAGYQDPALGWIGIRAEVSGGAVHATLVPQSADAAQALSAHFTGLHAYLAENHTPVETLTLSAFGGNAQQFTGQHSGQETHQGTGQNASQGDAAEAVPATQSIAKATLRGPVRGGTISDEFFTRSNNNISSAGVHISVLA